MNTLIRRVSCLVSALALLSVPGRGSAQSTSDPPRSPSRVPVTVALLERLPYPDAPFIILRQSAGTDYILLPEDADAALLTDAVNALLLARQQGGDWPAADAVLRARVPGRSRGTRPLPWVVRVLSDLRESPPRNIPGVGDAPTVRIWLPPQNPRGRPMPSHN